MEDEVIFHMIVGETKKNQNKQKHLLRRWPFRARRCQAWGSYPLVAGVIGFGFDIFVSVGSW